MTTVADIRRRWFGLPKDCPVGTSAAQRDISFLLEEIERLKANHAHTLICLAGAYPSQPVGDSRSPNPERGNGHMSETTVEYTCGMCGKRFRYDTENMTMCAVKHPPGTCCHQNEQPVPSHETDK